jgi:hypothetical protein
MEYAFTPPDAQLAHPDSIDVAAKQIATPATAIARAARSQLEGTMRRIDDSISMPKTTGQTIPLVDGPRSFGS